MIHAGAHDFVPLHFFCSFQQNFENFGDTLLNSVFFPILCQGNELSKVSPEFKKACCAISDFRKGGEDTFYLWDKVSNCFSTHIFHEQK
ncbi:MAG: hypothetical protein B6245_14420 [Desulfobacteraceae bacterium 4572_88]|nr:MAG: hypothetical protein B6245_14420 [Desulfobacteraceae bacterium 4572_88]